MPKDGEEVLITELEAELLSVFVKRRILDDGEVANLLSILAEKLDPKEN